MPATYVDEIELWARSGMEPKTQRSAQTVTNVETAKTDTLKSKVLRVLEMPYEPAIASAADRRIPASPPKIRIQRKMNVSETDTWPLTPGMGTAMRDAKTSVINPKIK